MAKPVHKSRQIGGGIAILVVAEVVNRIWGYQMTPSDTALLLKAVIVAQSLWLLISRIITKEPIYFRKPKEDPE